MLLAALLSILQAWIPAFCQSRSGRRAVAQSLGSLLSWGRRTLSRSLWALGLQHQDWSADYKLHARARWDPNALFQPVLERAAPLCPGPFSGDGPGRHPHPQDRPQDYVGFLPARSALTEVPLQSDVGPSFSPREFTGAPVPVFSRCFTALLAAPLSRSSGSEKARQESHRRAT